LYSIEGNNQLEKNFSTLTTVTREGPGLWEKCNTCGLSINRIGVAKEKAGEFYNKTYQKKNSLETEKTLSPELHFKARKNSVNEIVKKLLPILKPSMRIYELGAGAGELLFYLKDKVKHCEGNEINQAYSDFINKELKIKCNHKSFIEEKFIEPFDMIVSICTIDHIYETREVVERIYENLKEGGIFYLEIPNDYQVLNKYLSPKFSNSFSKFMYQKAHYYSFNSTTIETLLRQVGFKIQKKESRQEYTLKNFLNWYFAEKPQHSFNKATSDNKMLSNFDDKLEREINDLFINFEEKFKNIVEINEAGDTICILANK